MYGFQILKIPTNPVKLWAFLCRRMQRHLSPLHFQVTGKQTFNIWLNLQPRWLQQLCSFKLSLPSIIVSEVPREALWLAPWAVKIQPRPQQRPGRRILFCPPTRPSLACWDHKADPGLTLVLKELIFKGESMGPPAGNSLNNPSSSSGIWGCLPFPPQEEHGQPSSWKCVQMNPRRTHEALPGALGPTGSRPTFKPGGSP